MLNSNYRELGPIKLPYKGRQLYMHSFNLDSPKMFEGFEDYLESVETLCRIAGAIHGIAHMTVDEKIVRAGMSQRRPKPHIDGCFMPATQTWDHGPGWLHYCNDIGAGGYKRMSVIVASSAEGCRVWKGKFNGYPDKDGNLAHISDQLDQGEILPPNVGYLFSPDCIHESMILQRDTQRTFLRIALPVDKEYLCL